MSQRECPYCEGVAEPYDDLTFSQGGKTVTGLKGWKCTQCGEVLYYVESVTRIENEFG
ncbi:MAG: YgiT-type zinc finger protein [Candidatus Hodarchaeota archaeon]